MLANSPQIALPLTLPLSRSELDRAAHLRGDEAALDEMWQRAKIIELLGDRFRCAGGSLEFLTSNSVTASEKEAERYFLGLDKSGTPYFVLHQSTEIAEFPSEYESLRTIGKSLNPLEIGAAVHALAIAQWHDAHRRCAKCGAQTNSTMGGAVRKCEACESDHHPRTDPAVIVLVKDKDDRILLGHQPVWPANRFSTFAGFVEPGESFEECVSREVFEEAGVYASEIKYITSQPWPFPASIMIAFEAITHRPEEARPDGTEITEVRWFSRDDMKKAVAAKELLLPPTMSVARRMIQAWYTSVDGYTRDQLRGGESWRP